MALSDSEIQSLRRHLGYGNVSVGAYPYTPDGFYELFTQVIAPNLQTALETSSTTAVTAGTTQSITLGAVTGIAAYTRLVVDVGDDAEIVTVKAVSGSAVTAAFAKAHTSAGYPVAIESGTSTLRMLLHAADRAYDALVSSKVTSSAGLRSVGQGEVEWFEGGMVLKGVLSAYRAISNEIGYLVRVRPLWASGCSGQLEAY